MNMKELQNHPNWSLYGFIDVTKTPEEIQLNNKSIKALMESQETMAMNLVNRLEKTPIREVFEKEGVKNLARKNVVKSNEMRNFLNKIMFLMRAKIKI